jgi:O-antigen/teichoic acid export membrane protein
MVIGAVLVARDRQRAWTAVGVAAAILNPLVNLVAIPYTQAAFGNGAIGAAAVTSLTELFMMVMGLRLVPAGTFDRSVLLSTARVLLACVPVAAVAWLTREQPLIVPIALGGIAYAIACLLTRAVTVADVRAIAGHLVNRRSQLEAAA